MRSLAFALLTSILAWSQGTQQEFSSIVKNVSMPDYYGTEQTSFHSKFTDNDYNVQISLPTQYADGTSRFPVFYVLDSVNMWFTAASSMRGLNTANEAEPCILVGINLKVNSTLEWARKRTSDFTPTPVKDVDEFLTKLYKGEVKTGEAEKFRRTLKEELIPWVDSRYRTTRDRGLGGYSFSGLFVIWELMTNPGYFQRFIAGSPSIGWDNNFLLKKEAESYSGGKQISGQLFLSAGSLENGLIPALSEFENVLKSRSYSHLSIKRIIFEGENHTSAAHTTFARGIKELYPRYRTVGIEGRILGEYSGWYRFEDNEEMEVKRSGQKLVINLGGTDADFLPASETKFYSTVGLQISFTRSQEGKVEKLTLHQPGGETTAKRIVK